ncbi:cation-translocating P-type ATPase [Mycetocola miduiensis]|uniref:Ca2+-transporting ATPase n=1 Tax=Mycetocola miduiensis TaxID=995034 RepID=A0A1I4ZWK5_9MICO|nr:HAD-IC family P-type ATPase [Mycetocola miduiensis]SFN54430.1 Ca2+-transporting ATPase [Mycetocola miduiensis]
MATQRAADADPALLAQRKWFLINSQEALRELMSSENGLSSTEAESRLQRYGPNELSYASSTPWWRVLLRQFLSPVIGVLVIAAVISAATDHPVDAIAISLILGLNAALGFWQERKAEADVRALQSLSVDTCRVLRDATEHVVSAADVVPGDIVLIESGERIPADMRLLQANALRVDESMLTGESVAASKRSAAVPVDSPSAERSNMAFSGTFVTSGRGVGVVTATGVHTQLGEINALVQGPAGTGPLQMLTHKLERRIGLIVLVSVTAVFVAGVLTGNSISEMFRTAVALAVASIPESLPIVLTVAMSVGVSRMATRNAILRTLPSVETLGSTTVIASDKTGTLTQNRLTVERIWTPDSTVDVTAADGQATESPTIKAVLLTGALTNEATRGGSHSELTGDAVDVAMARTALEFGVLSEEERAETPRAHMPYEPDLRYSQTVRVDERGRRVLHVKGSADTLLSMSDSLARHSGTSELDHKLVQDANSRMAADGLRVIATATRTLEPGEELSSPLPTPSGLTFLGLQGMSDPPRADVAAAIRACQEAGIAVKMITGDQPLTATAIAKRLGLPTDVPPLTGAEMAELDDDALTVRLAEVSVAARVTPQDKLRIVRLLQAADHVVAVTGDGVNDAPALKAAAIGVAMGRSGTDVARESADLVLTDDNFVTIVHAVEQGRVTFAAIRKATFFLLSTGAAALLAMSANVVLNQPLLFLPLQMLWINIVTNGVQDIALALEAAEGDELKRPPRDRTEGLLSRTLWYRTGITATWMAVAILVVFTWAFESGMPEVEARTFTLTVFVALNFFQVLSARAQYRSLFQLNPLGNKLLLFTSVGALLLHWGAMQWSVSAEILGLTPLSPWQWAVCLGVGSSVLLIVEAEKLVRRSSHRREPSLA